jgi:Tol biopolymer transport system component
MHVIGDSGEPRLTGVRLGGYEIKELLGSGGMGEVYRALDTKLGREVALKILPRAFATDAASLARFEREARTLAALNHPCIAAIYGVEEAEAIRALVLELVEGETLADRVTRGPIAVAEALTIAHAVAEALGAAHEKGIVHRDLKPANIKITDDGTVKVLDFGIAKVIAGERTGVDVTQLRTNTGGATREGVVVGTAAYMSPEQARGRPVDKRADIWAFGCVLYEMLSGRVTFGRDTLTDTLVAVLERTPDWSLLPPSTPTAVRRLLRRCLEKDQRRRLHDIADAAIELEEAFEPADSPLSTLSPLPHVAFVEFKRLTDFVGLKECPAISPDGKMVAFVAVAGGRRQIWIRMLAGGAPLQLTRQDVDHEQPRWAPDSSALIYYIPSTRYAEEGTIWEISALGGWPRKVTSAINGGDISHDGRRIALFRALGNQPALMTLERDGSGASPVTVLTADCGYTSPRWSPDDRSIAFQRISSRTGGFVSIEKVSVVDGRRQDVGQGQWMRGLSWLADGSGLVYSSSLGSTLWYPPIFNLRATTMDGHTDRQLTFGDQSYVEPDTRHSDRLLATRIRNSSDIWKIPVDRSPAENTQGAIRITHQTGQVRTPSPSPDETELVYLSDNGGHGNLWVTKADGSDARQITFVHDPAVTVGVPKWSPATDLIVFVMSRREQVGLWAVHADGSGLRQVVADGRSPCWSGDGRWLYYVSVEDGTPCFTKISIDGGEPITVRQEPGADFAVISPDGTALYYIVTLRTSIFGAEGSDREVRCARPEDGPCETVARIRAERIRGVPSGVFPAVSPDGRWLAIPLADGATTNLWVLPTAGGTMKPITDFGGRSVDIARSIAWSADGRFIYAALAEVETDIVLLEGLIQ